MKNLFRLLVLFLCFGCGIKEERKYYPNGKLFSVVKVNEEGKKQGIEVEYFESGDTSLYRTWQNGIREGKSIVYFPNKKINQINYFKKGLRCCESSFFSEDGHLIEVQYLDSLGRVIDYKKFDRDGKRRFRQEDVLPLVLSKSDTINLGDYYEAEIRLGNRKWDSIRVVLGAWDDYQSLFGPNLPSIDSVTSFVRVKAENEGKNVIEGTIIEVNTMHTDSAIMHPFRFFFFVRDKKKRAS